MSEPPSAFLKLRVPRQKLVRWLDGTVRSAATWSDWREVGGCYHFAGGPRDLPAISDDEMAEKVAECDTGLRGCATNRAALRAILGFAEAKFLARCTYDDATSDFVAGTLTYDENLIRYLQFFTIARGAVEALEADGSGVALLHNYVWSPDLLGKAIKLRPGATSAFMSPDDTRAAVPLFQPIVDDMLAIAAEVDEELDNAPAPIDVLGQLK